MKRPASLSTSTEYDTRQAKGIITCAGRGTKIILMGGPHQIDRPFLDERANGLSYASGKMKESPSLHSRSIMLESERERSKAGHGSDKEDCEVKDARGGWLRRKRVAASLRL